MLLIRVAPLLAATGWAATLVAWAGRSPRSCSGWSPRPSATSSSCWPRRRARRSGSWCWAPGWVRRRVRPGLLVAHAAAKALLFLAAGGWLAVLRQPVAAGAARGGPAAPGGRRDVHRRGRGAGRAAAAVAVVDQGRGAGRGAARGRPADGGRAARHRAVGGLPRPARRGSSGGPTRSPSIRRGADRRAPPRPGRRGRGRSSVLAVPAAAVGVRRGRSSGSSPGPTPGELVTTGVDRRLRGRGDVGAAHPPRPAALHRAPPPRRRRPAGGCGLEAATRAVVVRPVLALARLLDRADRALAAAPPRVVATVPRLARVVEARGERPLGAAVAGLGAGDPAPRGPRPPPADRAGAPVLRPGSRRRRDARRAGRRPRGHGGALMLTALWLAPLVVAGGAGRGPGRAGGRSCWARGSCSRWPRSSGRSSCGPAVPRAGGFGDEVVGAVDPGVRGRLPPRRGRALRAAGGDDDRGVPGRGALLAAPPDDEDPARTRAFVLLFLALEAVCVGLFLALDLVAVLRLLRPVDRAHVLRDRRVGHRAARARRRCSSSSTPSSARW